MWGALNTQHHFNSKRKHHKTYIKFYVRRDGIVKFLRLHSESSTAQRKTLWTIDMVRYVLMMVMDMHYAFEWYSNSVVEHVVGKYEFIETQRKTSKLLNKWNSIGTKPGSEKAPNILASIKIHFQNGICFLLKSYLFTAWAIKGKSVFSCQFKWLQNKQQSNAFN